jgi:hypothetical protein
LGDGPRNRGCLVRGVLVLLTVEPVTRGATAINYWENRTPDIRVGDLRQLAEILGCRARDLLAPPETRQSRCCIRAASTGGGELSRNGGGRVAGRLPSPGNFLIVTRRVFHWRGNPSLSTLFV